MPHRTLALAIWGSRGLKLQSILKKSIYVALRLGLAMIQVYSENTKANTYLTLPGTVADKSAK